MRIRVIDAGAVAWCKHLRDGLGVESVGDFAFHVKPGDGLMVYTTTDNHATCNFVFLSLVVSVEPSSGCIVVDSRAVDVRFNPDRHALAKWRANPYLAPDKAKVRKYKFLDCFAEAFRDSELLNARLEDCVRYVFRPDLSVPTLYPVVGYVYLFRRPDLYKIGKSTDLSRRQKELEREHGVELKLLHSFLSNDYTRAEGLLLAKYRPKLREGAEWFDLTDEDVQEIRSIIDYGLDK